MSGGSERRLFWRDGECFVGDMNIEESTATNLKILRMNDSGDLLSLDAGMGITGPDAVWDLTTMSVAVKKEVCVCAEEADKKKPTVLQFTKKRTN